MTIISDNLIHFLARSEKDNPEAQLEICKKIFERGLRTSTLIIRFPDGDYVYNQAVCLTDIPLRECDEHTSIYGKFGIGFKKSYIKNSGGNPARYFLDYFPSQFPGFVECRGSLCSNLSNQFKFFMELSDFHKKNPNSNLVDGTGSIIFDHLAIKKYLDSCLYAMSFDKEMGDLGPARDETKEIDLYYKEREWRLVPTKYAVDSGIVEIDNSDNSHYYKFKRSDVNMVVVPNEEMRKRLQEYFYNISIEDKRLLQYKENMLPIINYDDLHKW